MQSFNRPILLASKSPRRSFLMREAGFAIDVRSMDVEEIYPDSLPVDEVAPYLATLKATGCSSLLTAPEQILLTADSVVILDNTIFGKPKDYDDAVRILQQLSGQVHRVITGVCLLSQNKKVTFAGVSKVHVLPLQEEEIHYYLKKFQPFDKAGSYGIQDWFGLCKVARIEGSYSNIMGLPIELVYDQLHKF